MTDSVILPSLSLFWVLQNAIMKKKEIVNRYACILRPHSFTCEWLSFVAAKGRIIQFKFD